MTALAGVAVGFGPITFLPGFDRGLGGTALELRNAVVEAERPTFPARTEEILDRVVTAIAEAEEDGEFAADFDLLPYAVALIESLPTSTPLPRVVFQAADEIGLDWDFANDAVVSVTIDFSDRVGYSALIGRESSYGLLPVGDEMPPLVHTLVDRAHVRSRRRT